MWEVFLSPMAHRPEQPPPTFPEPDSREGERAAGAACRWPMAAFPIPSQSFHLWQSAVL